MHSDVVVLAVVQTVKPSDTSYIFVGGSDTVFVEPHDCSGKSTGIGVCPRIANAFWENRVKQRLTAQGKHAVV